jgi:hypothetical protein
VLVGLPRCLRGLSELPFAAVLQKIGAQTMNGKLMRVIINGFSVACGRMRVEAVALLDSVLSLLAALPPESENAALPGDIGAALLDLMENDLKIDVDEDARALLLPRLIQERSNTSGLESATDAPHSADAGLPVPGLR